MISCKYRYTKTRTFVQVYLYEKREQALKNYKDGEILEARVALETVVRRIDAWEVAEELRN